MIKVLKLYHTLPTKVNNVLYQSIIIKLLIKNKLKIISFYKYTKYAHDSILTVPQYNVFFVINVAKIF